MKIGPKILIFATLLCVVFYAGMMVGRISARDMIYLPHVEQSVNTNSYARIDLNEAGVDDLTMLPGVGPGLATEIVEYRKEYGEYVDIDELLDVEGMTRQLYNEIKQFVTVGG